MSAKMEPNLAYTHAHYMMITLDQWSAKISRAIHYKLNEHAVHVSVIKLLEAISLEPGSGTVAASDEF